MKMEAEPSQPEPSWWKKFPPNYVHPFAAPEKFVASLRQLSQEELADYLLYRAITPEENSKPSIDIIHDETPMSFLIASAKSNLALGEKITQATAVLFNKFAIKSKESKTFSADDKKAMRQLSWLVTFGLSELKGNEKDLLEMKDSINYLADAHRFHYPNSMSDELDQSAARALLYAQFSLAKEGDPYQRWLNIWEEAATVEGDVKYIKSGWGFRGLALVAPIIAITKIRELVGRMTSVGTDSADYKMLFHSSSLELLDMFDSDTAKLKEALGQINPVYAERVISYLKTYVE